MDCSRLVSTRMSQRRWELSKGHMEEQKEALQAGAGDDSQGTVAARARQVAWGRGGPWGLSTHLKREPPHGAPGKVPSRD